MNPDEIAKVLGQPITINKLTLANRMVKGPMAANFPNDDGTPGEQTVAFYEARARGGVSLIIIGGMATPSETEKARGKFEGLRLDVDSVIPAFRRLADAVHAHGVPIIAELVPGMGRMAHNGPLISASPVNVVIPEDRWAKGIFVPGGLVTRPPREATVDEIRRREREMIETAERAHRAGLDGVEVAAHMSYFAASFLTPRTNLRTDEYGGSVENRARMLVNIVSGIRARLGRDFLVGLRITSNEYLPDGQGAQGYAAIAKLVEAQGIDYVALSPGCYETQNIAMSDIDGIMVDSGDARVFKQALSVPVFLQGIHDPARIAKAIAGGDGDVIMLSRPVLADPDYPRKVLQGRPDSITMCNRDNYCVRRFVFHMPVRCQVNPSLGLESRGSKGPPLSRIIKAPVEEAILKVTGSRRVMKLASALRSKGH